MTTIKALLISFCLSLSIACGGSFDPQAPDHTTAVLTIAPQAPAEALQGVITIPNNIAHIKPGTYPLSEGATLTVNGDDATVMDPSFGTLMGGVYTGQLPTGEVIPVTERWILGNLVCPNGLVVFGAVVRVGR